MSSDERGGSRRLPADSGSGEAHQALALATQALDLARLALGASDYARKSRAANTRRAYSADWRHFTGWCDAFGFSAVPCDPETLRLYLTAHAQILTRATLKRRLASVSLAHQAEGLPSPTRAASVREVWAGIVRSDRRPVVRKTPLVVEAMRRVLDQLDDSPRGRRDRALLLLAWGGALRRSEVVSLSTGDVRVEDRGLVLYLARSKTDQLGEGREIGLPYGRREEYCPVRSYVAWSSYLRGRDVPVFVAISDGGLLAERPLADKQVARLVKRVAAQAGLVGDYSGHSLRAGFATAAAAAGASERSIMAQTGHRSLLIMRGYIRPQQLFDDNAAAIAAL